MSEKEKPGYISVYRKIQDHWIWQDPERFRAWMDILFSAQFHDSDFITAGMKMTVPTGSWFISIRSLENRWGWSRNKIRRFLRTLSDEQMITIKRTSKGMVLTVVNYGVYQNSGTSKGTPKSTSESTSLGTSEGTSLGPRTNKGNKGNKGNKIDEAFLSKCTYTKEEGDNYSRMVKAGEKPFPNAATEDEYWKRELEERRKDW